MTRVLKFRRGTTAEHAVFTGEVGEVTVNTDKDCLIVHDALTVGGIEHVNLNSAQRLTNKDIVATELNVTGVSTFAGAIDANGNLDVDGFAELDATNISETLNVVGLSTFGSDVDINASIDVDGHTELDDLNVSGVSTFAGAIDANGDLDVNGRTELDTTNISETLNVVGISTFSSDVDINASIDVSGTTTTGQLNVTGVSTLSNVVVGGATTSLIVNGDARITGILTIGTASITFDGINNTVTVGSATTLDSTGFVGSGANLTSLNASNLDSGTIPDSRFPATLPSASGANLTSLNASNLGSGTIPDARFPTDLIFAAGTLMLFQQTSAPTGWTKQTTHNNKALRVVSGTASSGGSTAFTSVFASRTPTGSVSVSGTNSSGSVTAATLTTAQIPSHNHSPTVSGSFLIDRGAGGSQAFSGGSTLIGLSASTTSTGSGNSHNHGFTNPTWSGSGSFTGTAMDFDVQYVDLIIASKNA